MFRSNSSNSRARAAINTSIYSDGMVQKYIDETASFPALQTQIDVLTMQVGNIYISPDISNGIIDLNAQVSELQIHDVSNTLAVDTMLQKTTMIEASLNILLDEALAPNNFSKSVPQTITGNYVFSGDVKFSQLVGSGVLYNDLNGNLYVKSSFTNADISVNAGITDDKLATIETAGKVLPSAVNASILPFPNTIVLRDASGDILALTLASDVSDNRIANTEFVQNNIALVVDTSPETLNTLNKLANAIGGDASFSETIYAEIDKKVSIANPTFTANVFATNLGVRAYTQSGNLVFIDASGLWSSRVFSQSDVSGIIISDSQLDTISTAGKVANSATTATTDSSANTVMLRGVSGEWVNPISNTPIYQRNVSNAIYSNIVVNDSMYSLDRAPSLTQSQKDNALTSPWRFSTISLKSNSFRSTYVSPDFSSIYAVYGDGIVCTQDGGVSWINKVWSNGSPHSITYSTHNRVYIIVGDNLIKITQNFVDYANVNSPLANTWKSVVYSNEGCITVAVGTNSCIYCNDASATIWAAAPSVPVGDWNSVVWSPELKQFVAVGPNVSMYSYDGIYWNASSNVPSGTWQQICWCSDLHMYCAVAPSGTYRIMLSADGIQWIPVVSIPEMNAWQHVCWSPDMGMLCAVSSDGSHRLMASNDGFHWQLYSIPENSWRLIVWSQKDSVYMALHTSESGEMIMSALNARIPSGYTLYNHFSSTMNGWGDEWQFQSLTLTPSGIIGLSDFSGNVISESIVNTSRQITTTNGNLIVDGSFGLAGNLELYRVLQCVDNTGLGDFVDISQNFVMGNIKTDSVWTTTSTYRQIGNITLDSGEWNVVYGASLVPSGSGDISGVEMYISTIDASNQGVISGSMSYDYMKYSLTNQNTYPFYPHSFSMYVSSPTTYYLNGYVDFGSGISSLGMGDTYIYAQRVILSLTEPPTNLSILDISTSSIRISYTASPTADSYIIKTIPETTTTTTTETDLYINDIVPSPLNNVYQIYVYSVSSSGYVSYPVSKISINPFVNNKYYYKFDVGDFSDNLGIVNYNTGVPVYDVSVVGVLESMITPVLGINNNIYTATGYTNTIQNGVYDISASSSARGSGNVYFAFDNSNSSTWTTDFSGSNGYTRDPYDSLGNYVGGGTGKFYTTTTTTGTISGEWIQLKTPYSHKMTKYSMSAKTPYILPKLTHILGSNNGNSWQLIDTKTTQNQILNINSSSFGSFSTHFTGVDGGGSGTAISGDNSRLFTIAWRIPPKFSTFNRITNTWSPLTTIGTSSIEWYGCAMSNDGNRVAVALYGKRIYQYIWNGHTYIESTISDATARNYISIAMTKDGSRIGVCVENGLAYYSDWNSGTGQYGTLISFGTSFSGGNPNGRPGIDFNDSGNAVLYGTTTGIRYATWNGTTYETKATSGALTSTNTVRIFFFPDNRNFICGNAFCSINPDTNTFSPAVSFSTLPDFLATDSAISTIYLAKDGTNVYYQGKSNGILYRASVNALNPPLTYSITNANTYNNYRFIMNTTYPSRAIVDILSIDISGELPYTYNPINVSNYQVGNASLYLDKAFSSYLILPSFPSTNTGFSTSFWVRGNTDASNVSIFDFGEADASNSISARFVNGVPRLYMNQNNTPYSYDIGTTSLTNNSWNHISWSISSTGTWKAYLNGASVGTTGVSIYPTQVERTTNYIGKYITDTTNARLASFYVDDFRTYNSEIDSIQVKYLYNNNNITPVLSATNISILDVSSSAIRLSYTASPNASSYEIRTIPETTITNTTSTDLYITGISPSPLTTIYDVYVYSINRFGQYSSPLVSSQVASPTNISILDVSESSIQISYTANPNASSYVIKTDPETAITTTSNTNIRITGISPSPLTTLYRVYVYGVNSGGYYSYPINAIYNQYNIAQNIRYAASVRKLVIGYNGPVVQVRRSSDSIISDFYTDTTQSYLTTGINGTGESYASWIGESTGYITILYNQNGSSNHARNNANNTTQPNIILRNGKYIVQWDAARQTILTLDTVVIANTFFGQVWNSNDTLGTIAYAVNSSGSSVDLGIRLFVFTGGNINDWYYSSTGTKLSYLNGSTPAPINGTYSVWNTLSMSVQTPSTSQGNVGFKIIGRDGFGAARSITGYMTDFIFHNKTMSATEMLAFYNNRLIRDNT